MTERRLNNMRCCRGGLTLKIPFLEFSPTTRKAGVKHIVHLGACGDNDTRVAHYAWHQFIERYIGTFRWNRFLMANLLPLIHLQIGSVFARFREPRKCGILSVLGNPGGEPRPGPSDPDEEYRASARIRRRRRKHVVNAKIAIHCKLNACKI